MRVWPTDADVNLHINNGVYFSLMDLGRFDLTVRSGIWRVLRERRRNPVAGAETISFRRSLRLWQRFSIESRIIGVAEKAVFGAPPMGWRAPAGR
ncbi:thioesterase family protein [Specibacter cremeus]|uniref:thioesterase family protein n=1 Tax=Specibacter cremeus TaxID=1629051 RepID=UPI0030B8599C